MSDQATAYPAEQRFPTVLVGAGVLAFILVAIVVRRLMSGGGSTEAPTLATGGKVRFPHWAPRTTGRKALLTLLITALEHDKGRRLVVAGLKMARNRV